MTDQVIPGDPVLRRRAVTLLLAAAVIGALVLTIVSGHLRQVSSVAILQRWLWGTVALASGGGVAFGAYLAWLARQVLLAGQFPPPGRRVIRDTRLRRGRAARRIAWLAMGAAGVMWAVSVALPLLLWRLLRLLGA
jgi:hypothetical protein